MESYTFTLPSNELLAKWRRGSAISDVELSLLLGFFKSMLHGCEALGDRYSLATTALWLEWGAAHRMYRNRQNEYHKNTTGD